MINFRPARIATTTAILIMLASSAAVPAMARPSTRIRRQRLARSSFQTHRCAVRCFGSTGNSSGVTT